MSGTIFDLIRERKWQQALRLVEKNPDCVYEQSEFHDRLPIHELCRMRSIGAVLLEDGDISSNENGTTDGLNGNDNDNDSVHRLNLLQAMVEASHKMGPVSVPHEILSNELEVHIEQVIHTSVLTVTDFRRMTPLHHLCHNWFDARWVHLIFSTLTQQQGAPSIQTLLSARNSFGITPLHFLACSKKCPFSVLRAFMDYCKPIGDWDPTTLADGNDGGNPLHWAFESGTTPRRIKELLRYGPTALAQRNLADQFPLDKFLAYVVVREEIFAAGYLMDPEFFSQEMPEDMARAFWDQIVWYLPALPVHPEAPRPEPLMPLHRLASTTFPFDHWIFDLAIRRHQSDLSVPDSTGRLPLHWACECNNSEKATKLLEALPSASSVQAGNGRLALHIALDVGAPYTLIDSLLKAYPKGLYVRDPITKLYPCLMAGVSPQSSLETSFVLLRADPSLVMP